MKKFRVLSLLICFILVFLSLPATAFDLTAEKEKESEKLLNSAKHSEDYVIAGVDFSKKDTGVLLGFKSDPFKDCETVSVSESGITTVIVPCKEKTPGEMLDILFNDRRVVYAEPDYLMEYSGADLSADFAKEVYREVSGEDNPGSSGKNDISEADDLTGLQWSNTDSPKIRVNNASASSANIEGFESQEYDRNIQPVTVAVLDTAIDFENSDLKDLAYTFSDEDMEALGCDRHGYNATIFSQDGKLKIFDDEDIHGTHCAGIIGAQWNGKGTSGASPYVKFISVQIINGNEYTPLCNVLRAYAFVGAANNRGADIRVVSNSWGLIQSCRSVDAVVRELGEKYGTVSIFAAGNDTVNMDLAQEVTSSLADNPYAIVVASTDQTGGKSSFSNYGPDTVTLAAPGSGIISTVPVINSTYIPYATKSGNKYYEDFDDGQHDIGLSFFDGINLREIKGEFTGEKGVSFDGGKSLRIKLDDNYAYYTGEGENVYFLVMDLGITMARGMDSLYFGAALHTDNLVYVSDYFTVTDSGNINYLDGCYQSNAYNPGGSWACAFSELPKNEYPGGLKAGIVFYADADDEYLYLDTVGTGYERVSYDMISGTSMACPLVSGVASTVAAKTGLKGIELASAIRAKTRPDDYFNTRTKTGGVIDMSSKGTFAPVIVSVRSEGGKLIIEGTGFLEKEGKAGLYICNMGQPDRQTACTVESWNNEKIILNTESKIEGGFRIRIENADGYTDSAAQIVENSSSVYENDYGFDSDTGKPFLFDSPGDWETSGILAGLGERLYWIPECIEYEDTPAFGPVYVFDTHERTWGSAAPLPEWLENASCAVYEGMLAVKGTRMSTEFNMTPMTDESADSVVYTYSPEKNVWEKASASGVENTQTLINIDGNLYLAGTTGQADIFSILDFEHSTVCEYSTKTGAGKKIADIDGKYDNPECAVSGDILYLYDTESAVFGKVENGTYTDLTWALPETLVISDDSPTGSEPVDYAANRLELAAVREGLVLIGPVSSDGAADTFILENGSSSFKEYGKRLSDMKTVSVNACAYAGQVYAIATSWAENGQRVFRSFGMDTYDIKGDIPYDGKTVPSEPGDNPVPTPAPGGNSNRPVPSGKSLTLFDWMGIGVLVLFIIAVVFSAIVLSRKKK